MYIVTGVDGHFGSTVAELVLAKVPASELIFTSWDVSRIAHWAERGVQVRQADFDDVDQTGDAFAGGDRLLLISTMLVGPRRQQQHRNAVQAAAEAGVRHIVYTSYLGSDDESNEAIVTLDHRMTEQAIFASGMTWNVMRDSQYSEAMTQQQAAVAVSSGKFFANQGDGTVAFVSRDDCAAVAAALLLGAGEPNTAYDVTGPELLTYREVCELIAEVSGVAVEYVGLTDDQFYAMWDAMGVPRESTGDFSASPFPWCSDDMVSFGRAIREGMMAVRSDAVETLTGRPPLTMRALMERDAHLWPVPTA
ncbi:MAG: NAD(P)H-binding protein [Cellulomonadaceae bacterium]|nr:NAD(P)H-binding protein [Cellulomonadaceae bacterium]